MGPTGMGPTGIEPKNISKTQKKTLAHTGKSVCATSA